MTGRPKQDLLHMDEEARKAARSVFDRPVVLEAGAGTGKTAALIARVMHWCLGPGWEKARRDIEERGKDAGTDRGVEPEAIAARVLERVTAITFTERAAAEMAERVAAALAGVLDNSEAIWLHLEDLKLEVEEKRRRASAMLTSLDRLVVGTIHAFCRRLLAAHPLEAGVHPSFEVDAEGTAVQHTAEEVLSDRLRRAYGDPGDPDLLALARLGYGPPHIAEALEGFVHRGVPPEALAGAPYPQTKVADARDRLLIQVRRVLGIIREPIAGAKGGRLDKAREALQAMEALEQGLPGVRTAEDLVVCVTADDLKAALGRLGKWANEEFIKSESFLKERKGELGPACKDLCALVSFLQKLDPEIMIPACRALCSLLTEVHLRMRTRGVETFDALLRHARDLLERSPEVLGRIRRPMDQLLVDEFQDTDPVQCRIVDWIALQGPRAERPGLFLVGDPKQSIYGWRDADLAAYHAFVRKVLEAGGEKHTLYVNFRSVPAILDEVERIAAPVMEEEEGVQPPFEPLLACDDLREEAGLRYRGRRPVEHWVSWDREQQEGEAENKVGPKTRADRAREIEAAAVARDLLDLRMNFGVDWKRSAILMRTTTAQDTYLGALRESGIPFVVERDRSYYKRREVIDAVSLVRAIVDPSDHVAMLAWLRSPVVGVPDAALIPLWNHKLPDLVTRIEGPAPEILEEIVRCVDRAAADLPQEQPDGLPGLDRVEGWDLSLASALRALARLRRSFVEDPADTFVERLRALLLSEATEAARFLGGHRLANLERFFRRLLEALVSGEGGPQAVLRELRAGISGMREEEEGSLADETLDAVRVLTIHKAKGLTFGNAYLVGLHGRTDRGSGGPETEVVEHGGGWEMRLFGVPSLGFDQVLARREQVSKAEMLRTLYVATTRPRERLVLAGKWAGDDAEARPTAEAASHMDLLLHRRGGHPALEELLAGAAGEGEAAEIDAEEVRWVLPDPSPVSRVVKAVEPGDEAVTVDEARRDIERLRVFREQALQRMGLGFTAPASQRSHEALREALYEGMEETPSVAEGVAGEAHTEWVREIEMAVGSAIHRVLETFEFSASTQEEIGRQRGLLGVHLRGPVPPDRFDEALGEAEEILERLGGSQAIRRLTAISEHIIAREMPILLAGDEEAGPVGAIIGTIDLLYRDPETRAFVVADYKTDRITDDAELEERKQIYKAQGEVYLRAVREAMGAEPPPRFELWFLRADRIIAVEA